MTVPLKVKISAGLLVVFAAGAICGSWAHSRVAERVFMKALDASNWAPAVVDGLDHDLTLTAEQKIQVRKLADESVAKVCQDFASMGEELVRLHVRLQSILTPEQRAKNARTFAGLRCHLKDKYHLTLPAPERDPAN